MQRTLITLFLIIIGAVSCGGPKSASVSTRDFPAPAPVPVMLEGSAAMEYAAAHYWDNFLKGNFPTDSTQINGVSKADVEGAMSSWALLVESISPSAGKTAMISLFDGIAAADKAIYEPMAELARKYFYDPNSPLRDESLYGPFAERLAGSPLTDPAMVTAYKWEAKMCGLNAPGTPAADFEFIDSRGRIRSLWGINAAWTVLIFGNPDCHACRELVGMMEGEVSSLIEKGAIAVADIYIDEDVDLWRENIDSYPREWINGFDHNFIIRQDLIYNIRALPSIYLLDSSKKVVLKDTTPEKLMQYLSRIPR